MPTKLEDCEVSVKYIKGYPSLAAFIASDTHKSTAIYRRFDRLSARNLLYLQSDLIELETVQDALDENDLHGSTFDKECVRNWQVLKARASEVGNIREKERLNVAMEIRSKLKEYSISFHHRACVLMTTNILRGSFDS